MRPSGFPYEVLVVEDHEREIRADAVAARLVADRAEGCRDEPYLRLAGIARNFDDAIQHLEMADELPDAIVLDDRLPEGGVTQSRSIEIMAWLHERCERDGVDPARRPRAVLWTANDAQLAYTFCVVGGMQFRDKRDISGDELPVDAIWAALAGRRWQPEPYPSGLATAPRRAPLPWLEAGWLQDAVLAVPRLDSEGVTVHTMRAALEEIRRLPHTPQQPSPEYPDNWPMAIRAAKRNGWVWVPLDRHRQIPAGALLPLVVDPELHRKPLPPYGPLPARTG